MFPFLKVSGDSFEQGFSHGNALTNEIVHNLELYFYRFQHECRLEKEVVLNRAAKYLHKIKTQNSAYYAGMQGIADGSGVDLIKIAALNVRYEILYYQYAQKGLADGCTAIAVTDARSETKQMVLAQNWDWFPNTAGAIVQAEHANGITSLAFTEAGILGGKIGLNSAGIGLLINGLISLEDDWRNLQKPFHVRCYEILTKEVFQNAIEVVTGESRACSANFIIGSSSGSILNIESAPQTFAVHVPQNGILVHTNHFLDPQSIGVSEPAEERIYTEHRLQRATEISRQHRGQVSQMHIKSWLSDHENFPNSVCQHRDHSIPDHEHYETVASVILNLSTQSLSITAGPPCVSEFKTYTLKGEDTHA